MAGLGQPEAIVVGDRDPAPFKGMLASPLKIRSFPSISRQWAAAMTLCFVLLLILPPVAGFALFFVFLHSPRHLVETRAMLGDMTLEHWLVTGALLSGAALVGWWGLQRLTSSHIDENLAAQAFQLLASVAIPHLLLSRWLEKRFDRLEGSQSTRSFGETATS
ncbi:Brp/Blh family beta-carotene 15,15'-dioxygenase [Lichenifustis flavocetrariae]|uniref:Brp/Blh family beta-carotene 15,15'-dioxygenase n=1 Tax=Lichenifustis flavocetrariae TaxID=2949735 RepID=A0AA42CNV7_9HYPH|nr:Brp/Blh family beta-carotene 15,15'-dioxygenase [Lichenifustis flavocetrariae]MCW6513216.1 Brp/Blh family beta-carotene 15,15'-dioxygenase [Lichenifustis flavocetrariae]